MHEQRQIDAAFWTLIIIILKIIFMELCVARGLALVNMLLLCREMLNSPNYTYNITYLLPINLYLFYNL